MGQTRAKKKKRSIVLVAGGAGYIGSHMVRALTDAGLTPVVFDNLSTGHRQFVPRNVAFVRGDLRSSLDLEKIFSRYRIDAVMHFAASSLVGESMQAPLKYYDNNVLAFVRLAAAMKKHGVKKCIFSSTAATYGEPKRLPIRETDPTVPTNTYGRSKLMIETMLQDLARVGDLSYIALRYFNACGAHESALIGEWHDPETHIIPNILQTASGRKKKLVIFGDDYATPDGTCVRDYIHVTDLCRAHLLALKALDRGVRNEVFNLGNGNGYSILDIVKAAEKTVGCRIPFSYGPRRSGDPARLVASAAKAGRMLGWKPQMNLNAIVQSAWRWELAHRPA